MKPLQVMIIIIFMGKACNIKMSIISKLTYRFNTILIKMPTAFLVEIGKLFLGKGPRIIKTFWKRTQLEDLHYLDFKTCCKATVIKAMGY